MMEKQLVIESKGTLEKSHFEASKDAFRARGNEVGEALAAAYLVPDEKLEKIIDHAMNLLARNGKKWNAAKIARKTAEYFKLQKAAPAEG